MAIRPININMESDSLLRVNALFDNRNAVQDYVNSATINVSVYESPAFVLSVAAAVQDASNVKIPIANGHGVIAGDYIRIIGSINYDGEYEVQSIETGFIVITETYVAETFTGNELLHKGIVGAIALVLSYVAGSNGNYEGVLPDTAVLYYNTNYYAIYTIDDSGNKLMIRKTWKAVLADL